MKTKNIIAFNYNKLHHIWYNKIESKRVEGRISLQVTVQFIHAIFQDQIDIYIAQDFGITSVWA